jgi:hypothetical protein
MLHPPGQFICKGEACVRDPKGHSSLQLLQNQVEEGHQGALQLADKARNNLVALMVRSHRIEAN